MSFWEKVKVGFEIGVEQKTLHPLRTGKGILKETEKWEKKQDRQLKKLQKKNAEFNNESMEQE